MDDLFEIAHNSDTEMLRSQITKLTEQNRELESIVSKRVPKLEKILSIMKEALEFYGETPNTIHRNLYEIDTGTKAREALAGCIHREQRIQK